MKEYNGFKNCGSWYKGNIHSHTTISDGMLTPEQSVKLYKAVSYTHLDVYKRQLQGRGCPGTQVQPVQVEGNIQSHGTTAMIYNMGHI